MGHVVPGVSVAGKLQHKGHEVFWIGSGNLNEQTYVSDRGICFYPVSCEKLRRYFSFSNFLLPFRVVKGFFQARKILKMKKPDVLFSKGGFVCVPVTYAARTLGIPIVTHESDSSCGLATRIIARYCDVVCLGNEKARIRTKAKVMVTGNPVRPDIFDADTRGFAERIGLGSAGKETEEGSSKKVVLVLGGSQGAQKINETIRAGMKELAPRCEVVLQTGKGKLSGEEIPGLHELEFLDEDLGAALALADVVVSRAGAGAIAELVSLCKPMILVPLGLDASRGDQITNAMALEEKGCAIVVQDYNKVIEKIAELTDNERTRDGLIQACRVCGMKDSAGIISETVLEVAEHGSEHR